MRYERERSDPNPTSVEQLSLRSRRSQRPIPALAWQLVVDPTLSARLTAWPRRAEDH